MITKQQFDEFSAYGRGFAVYWVGSNPDEPHVPNEKNPYPHGSVEWADWNRGNQAAMIAAMIAAQDSEE